MVSASQQLIHVIGIGASGRILSQDRESAATGGRGGPSPAIRARELLRPPVPDCAKVRERPVGRRLQSTGLRGFEPWTLRNLRPDQLSPDNLSIDTPELVSIEMRCGNRQRFIAAGRLFDLGAGLFLWDLALLFAALRAFGPNRRNGRSYRDLYSVPFQLGLLHAV